MRLGELLVAARVVTPEQVDHALRAQVVWGGRLGTNLVELGAADLDQLARALGRQHRVLAALARHFDTADRALQARLPVELAARWSVVPLMALSDGTIAVASLDPLDADARATIADALAIEVGRLVCAIAPELRVYYHLERVYHIPRDTRFMRTRGPSIPPFPLAAKPVPPPAESDADLSIPIDVDDTPPPQPPPSPPSRPAAVAAAPDSVLVDLGLGDVIDDGAALAPSPPPAAEPGRERRRYAKTLGDDADPQPPAVAPDTRALGRIAIRRVAIETGDVPRVVEPAPDVLDPSASFADAARAIRRGHNRERVAELAVQALERFAPACESAMLLVVRGEAAFGWKWFCRSGDPAPELVVPLAEPGLVPTVIERSTTARCGASDLGKIDLLLLHALGRATGDLVVVPIAIAGAVMCLIVTATDRDAPLGYIEGIAGAAATAFARLVRAASR